MTEVTGEQVQPILRVLSQSLGLGQVKVPFVPQRKRREAEGAVHVHGPWDAFFPKPFIEIHKGGQVTPVSYEAGLYFV